MFELISYHCALFIVTVIAAFLLPPNGLFKV